MSTISALQRTLDSLDEVPPESRDLIEWMNSRICSKVAIDIPSGVCARTGKILGTAFRAELTVAMACVKAGCEWFPGKEYAGRTVPVPIGIDTARFGTDPDVCVTFDRADISRMLPPRRPDSHKGTYGKVLMITGLDRYTSAGAWDHSWQLSWY